MGAEWIVVPTPAGSHCRDRADGQKWALPAPLKEGGRPAIPWTSALKQKFEEHFATTRVHSILPAAGRHQMGSPLGR